MRRHSKPPSPETLIGFMIHWNAALDIFHVSTGTIPQEDLSIRTTFLNPPSTWPELSTGVQNSMLGIFARVEEVLTTVAVEYFDSWLGRIRVHRIYNETSSGFLRICFSIFPRLSSCTSPSELRSVHLNSCNSIIQYILYNSIYILHKSCNSICVACLNYNRITFKGRANLTGLIAENHRSSDAVVLKPFSIPWRWRPAISIIFESSLNPKGFSSFSGT